MNEWTLFYEGSGLDTASFYIHSRRGGGGGGGNWQKHARPIHAVLFRRRILTITYTIIRLGTQKAKNPTSHKLIWRKTWFCRSLGPQLNWFKYIYYIHFVHKLFFFINRLQVPELVIELTLHIEHWLILFLYLLQWKLFNFQGCIFRHCDRGHLFIKNDKRTQCITQNTNSLVETE